MRDGGAPGRTSREGRPCPPACTQRAGVMSMTTPLPLGLAPYISPTTLTSAPTGILARLHNAWRPFRRPDAGPEGGGALGRVRWASVARGRLQEPACPGHRRHRA